MPPDQPPRLPERPQRWPLERPGPHDGMWMGDKWQAARKEYRCDCWGCSTVIRPGDRYCRRSLIDLDAVGPRGKWCKYITSILCLGCMEASERRVEAGDGTPPAATAFGR